MFSQSYVSVPSQIQFVSCKGNPCEWLHLKCFVKFTFLDCSCFINISKEFLHLLLHFLPTTMTLSKYINVQLIDDVLTLKHCPAVVVVILQRCAAARLCHADVACSGAAHHAVRRGEVLCKSYIFCIFQIFIWMLDILIWTSPEQRTGMVQLLAFVICSPRPHTHTEMKLCSCFKNGLDCNFYQNVDEI